jgi:hypothetical protein
LIAPGSKEDSHPPRPLTQNPASQFPGTTLKHNQRPWRDAPIQFC